MASVFPWEHKSRRNFAYQMVVWEAGNKMPNDIISLMGLFFLMGRNLQSGPFFLLESVVWTLVNVALEAWYYMWPWWTPLSLVVVFLWKRFYHPLSYNKTPSSCPSHSLIVYCDSQLKPTTAMAAPAVFSTAETIGLAWPHPAFAPAVC